LTADPLSVGELADLAALIDGWAATELADNPVVTAVEFDPAERRWFVRVTGEEKDVSTVRFTLRQRTLHHETFLLPAPEENHARCYEYLLRRNHELYGLAFEIGEEDAVFLAGQIDGRAVTVDELDRILGSTYAAVERCFPQALRIGFASRLARE
jgi:hypothetical protein